MEFVRFFFWRLFRRPRVVDIFLWRERSPWEKDHIEVVRVSDGWAQILRVREDGFKTNDSIKLQSLLAFYELKE